MFEHHLLVVLLAIIIDRVIGEPKLLWKRMTHPIVLFGRLIAFFETQMNLDDLSDQKRFWNGCLVIFLLLLIVMEIGFFIYILCQNSLWSGAWSYLGIVIEAIIASIFLAQKSLADHVKAVVIAFEQTGLIGARIAVSQIVGRDPDQLDQSGVARATIESLAENSSDGVIAPVFWFAILGLPGLMAYKMLNTADSMIGHKNARYKDFGYASAKLDDYANYIPARLSSLIILAAAWTLYGYKAVKRGFSVVFKDAKKHRSPNAGWPESAYAGILNIQLAGPRIYDSVIVDEPFQNANGKSTEPVDIMRSLKLFYRSMTLQTIIIAILCLFSYWPQ